MSKKRVKIGEMYKEYGELEGVLCRNCCNFILTKKRNDDTLVIGGVNR